MHLTSVEGEGEPALPTDTFHSFPLVSPSPHNWLTSPCITCSAGPASSLKARAGLFCSALEPQNLALCLAFNQACKAYTLPGRDRSKLGKGDSPESGPQIWKWGSSSHLSLTHCLTLVKSLLSYLSFPIAELENWPKAEEEVESLCFLVER